MEKSHSSVMKRWTKRHWLLAHTGPRKHFYFYSESCGGNHYIRDGNWLRVEKGY